MPLYPFVFEPIYKPKVWGGRTLEALGRELPGDADHLIGESWELADLDATSPSGGGGEPAHSRIVNGPLAGQTIDVALGEHGRSIHGTVALSDAGRFPLLVKLLDARQNLSVQVHPSEAYAAAHPDAHLKSEAWYVLRADRDAAIYKGVREGVSAERFVAAIESGGLEDLLVRIPVRGGDCHYLPSGTCHALGAGIVVAEVQTPSDTTFRVYDWGRRGRQLHVEQALQCIHFGPAETSRFEPGTRIERERTVVETLVRCEHFRIEKLTVRGPHTLALELNGEPRVMMVVSGEVGLTCRGGGCDRTRLGAVGTALLPADMDEPRLEAEGEATVLDVSLPGAASDAIA